MKSLIVAAILAVASSAIASDQKQSTIPPAPLQSEEQGPIGAQELAIRIETPIGDIKADDVKIPELPRYHFCNRGPDRGAGERTCTPCSSLVSGDAGKVDCLARHQGDYVEAGKCPSNCSLN